MNRFEKVEQLIALRKHGEAFALLKAMPRSGLNREDLAYYDVLVADVAVNLREPSLVQGLDEAIELFRFHPDTLKFARAKYAKGRWLIYRSEFNDAQEALVEAYSNYLRCQNLREVARSLNWLSYVLLSIGDVEASLDYLDRCRKIYQSLNDWDIVTTTTINLCILYLLAGRLKAAIAAASEIGPQYDHPDIQGRALWYFARAIPLALQGDAERATEIIEAARPLVKDCSYQEVHFQQYLGWIKLVSGDYDSAEALLRKGLQIAIDVLPDYKCNTVKRLLADTLVAAKKYDEAERAAQEAYRTSRESNERAEVAGSYRVFAQLDYHRRSLKSARNWFDRALEMFYLIKYRYELAVTRYLAAQTSLYTTDERLRLLSDARDYFEAEGVRPYIERVDRELSRLTKPEGTRRTVTLAKPSDRGSSMECPDVITGRSEMQNVLTMAERIAPEDVSIVLTGETGTGKDLMAKYIHYHSGRQGSFVAINSAAVPDSMVESELFGHSKGAFTGADRDKPGLFETADGGTIYLDEIADASPLFQASLLEVTESRCVRRLGETKARPVNFRLIAATNHDLESSIRDGQFRSDLYHRLNQFQIHLLPLKNRTKDFRPLVEYFLRTSGVDPLEKDNPHLVEQLSRALTRRDWPGNVRQLRAEINQLLLVSNHDLQRMVLLAKQSDRSAREYRELLRTLKEANNNQSLAARRLGIPESTLRYRLKKYQDRQHT